MTNEWRKRLKDPRPTLNSLRGPLYAGEAFFGSGRRAGKGSRGGGSRNLVRGCVAMLRKKGPGSRTPTPDQPSETMERTIRPKREELYDRDATAQYYSQYQRELSLTVFMIMIIGVVVRS